MYSHWSFCTHTQFRAFFLIFSYKNGPIHAYPHWYSCAQPIYQFINIFLQLVTFLLALFTHLVWVIQNFWNCIFIILLALLKFKIERMSVLLESSLKLNCYLEWWLFICCQINPDTVILPTLPGHTYLLLFISSTSSTLSLPSNIYIAFSFLYSSCNKTTIFPLRYCTAFFSHPFREVPHFPLLSSFPIFVPQTQRYSVITI